MSSRAYNVVKKKLVIDKFDNYTDNSLNFDKVYAKSFYNYYPTNRLNNSSGVGVAKFPISKINLSEQELNISSSGINEVKGVTYFKQYFPASGNTQHRILVYGDDKKLYINQLLDYDYDLYWLYKLEFNSAPVTLTYKKDDADAIILACEDSMVVWKTNFSPYKISNVPIITSMCINDGVLFCTIKDPAYKVWYATDLDAENIGNISKYSGNISLDDELGYARKILTFNENLYVFRDYGISKINFISTDNILTSQVYVSDTKIFANTVHVCGNVIMFMTKNGLYAYNGVKVSKINTTISSMLDFSNERIVASSLAGKYYLALRLRFDDDKQFFCEQDDYINNAIVVLDSSDYSYEIIRGVDVASMLAVKTEVFEKLLLTFNTGHTDKVGQIIEESTCFNESLPKFWASGELIENNKRKMATKLTVYAKQDVKINVIHDDYSTSFTTFSSGLNVFNFKIGFNMLRLEVSSDEVDSSVDRIELEYYEN